MPFVETPEELAEALADLAEIYGQHDDRCSKVFPSWKSMCRGCFVADMRERIVQAAKNDETLKRGF